MKLSQKEKHQMETISVDLRSKLKSIEMLDEPDKARIKENTLSMINYYQGMTEKEKDRLTNLYNFALQILIICIAGVSLIVAIQNRIPKIVFLLTAIILGIQIVASALIIIVHERQSEFRYPFLKLKEFGNKWKWFYYGNSHIQDISTHALRPTTDFSKTTEPYLRGLALYIDRYKDEKIENEIVDNIQQAYLLQVHNYFKNRFFLSLIKIRVWSVYLTIIFVVVILLLHFLFGFFVQNEVLNATEGVV